MQIVKLQPGERAPADSDSIRVAPCGGGKHKRIGSALLNCGDGDQAKSVSIIGIETYDTYEQAEAAGLAWAASHCVEHLYVEHFDA